MLKSTIIFAMTVFLYSCSPKTGSTVTGTNNNTTIQKNDAPNEATVQDYPKDMQPTSAK